MWATKSLKECYPPSACGSAVKAFQVHLLPTNAVCSTSLRTKPRTSGVPMVYWYPQPGQWWYSEYRFLWNFFTIQQTIMARVWHKPWLHHPAPFLNNSIQTKGAWIASRSGYWKLCWWCKLLARNSATAWSCSLPNRAETSIMLWRYSTSSRIVPEHHKEPIVKDGIHPKPMGNGKFNTPPCFWLLATKHRHLSSRSVSWAKPKRHHWYPAVSAPCATDGGTPLPLWCEACYHWENDNHKQNHHEPTTYKVRAKVIARNDEEQNKTVKLISFTMKDPRYSDPSIPMFPQLF